MADPVPGPLLTSSSGDSDSFGELQARANTVLSESAPRVDSNSALYEWIPVPGFCLDHAGKLRHVNRATCALLGATEHVLLGTALASLLLGPVDELSRHLKRVFATGAQQRCDVHLKTPHGSVHAHLDSVMQQDASRCHCALQLVDCRQPPPGSPPAIAERLVEAHRMEALGTLACGLAQDFTHLLMGVVGCANAALASISPNSTARMYLTTIRQSAQTGAALSKNLLRLSRRDDHQPTVFELDTLVARTIPMLTLLLGQQIPLHVEFNTQNARVRAHPAQIVQALMTLATNARDAMPTGGTVSLETYSVKIVVPTSQLAEGDYVALSITDAGCGMCEETLERIFEPLFTTKGPPRGGFRLATLQRCIADAGGQVNVTSRINEGSTFELLLPVANVSASGAAHAMHARVPD